MAVKNVLILIFLILNTIASATDYYISSSGNDTNNGFSSSTPWKTIAKVNSAFSIFKPGDMVLFKRGDTFYGTLKISASGASGNPIVISAYGTGQNPIITGFTTLSSWTNEGGNIYSESVTSEAQTNMVTIDGVQVAMGRYPDAGTNLNFESHSTNVSITDNETSSSTTNWTGAEVVINAVNYSLNRSTIKGHSGGVISYTQLVGTNVTPSNDGRRCFIQNDLRCVTATNEWYHSTSAGKLYIYGDPATKVIKMATLNYLINFGTYGYTTLDGLDIQGSILHAIYSPPGNTNNHITIKNCNISYAGQDGIHLSKNSYCLIDNNTISYCNQTGIAVSNATNGTITNNYVHHIGMIEGQGWRGTQYAGIYADGFGGLIQYNRVEYTGYCGIITFGTTSTWTVANNFVNYAMQLLDDGGGIYTASSTVYTRVIQYNIVLNSGVGNPYSPVGCEGIYLDEGSNNILVDHNTVANCIYGRGYAIHNGATNTHTDNTAYNNKQGFCYNNTGGSTRVYANILKENIIIAKDATQLVLFAQSDINNLSGFFSSADYNYYARPIKDDYVFYTNQPSTGLISRTLAEWQNFTRQDANSHKTPGTITNIKDIRFEYNATKTNKIITLDQPMIDVRGTKYFNSITLSAFTSAVLMVDPNPAQPVIPVYTSSVIENATPTILTMTYSLSLANIIPVITSFNVLVNSVSRAITSVVINGNKVQLTLASPVVYGNPVTVSYTKPSVNPLQTPSGGQAATISAQSALNNCTTPGNQPPIVIIASPTKSTSFISPAEITIVANASDPDGTIKKVEFFNGNIKLGELTSAPYSFTWKDVNAGTYSLTAVATDNLNSTTVSAIIMLTVNSTIPIGNKPPYIRIIKPVNGKYFVAKSTIDVTVDSYDPDGTISKVEYFDGTTKIGESRIAPYSLSFQNTTAGMNKITAIAFDNLSDTASSSVNLYVTIYDENSELIDLYPNPNDGHFSIEFITPLQNDISEVVITDLAGKKVFNDTVSKEETIKQIDLSYIKSGIYMLMIICKEILFTKKFIKN